MKIKAAGTLAAMSLTILAWCALVVGPSVRACTVFCDSQGETVLAGRSLDIPDNPSMGMLLVPATARTHGWVCFGRFAYPWTDGMNDKGLFVAVADCAYPLHSEIVPATGGSSNVSERPAGQLRVGG